MDIFTTFIVNIFCHAINYVYKNVKYEDRYG
nr:MAG TPA: hypothetical protein [Caudoviricetes sp.]